MGPRCSGNNSCEKVEDLDLRYETLFLSRFILRPRLTAGVLLFALIAIIVQFAIRSYRAGDETDDFLARHWAHPIAAQGDPPAHFAPQEASLAPQACGQCHQPQYADWRTSLHSRAIGPGIQWQLRVLGQDDANRCLRCHAPLAEQKALMALEHGWPNTPASPPPKYVPPQLHHEGLVCAACHVRGHRRVGPPAHKPQTDSRLPHDGFTAEPAFQDSRFCSTCHQFPPDGPAVNGKLLENTHEEWRMSPAADEGRTCQGCHMPGRRHLWRGIHDRETVRAALRRELSVTRLHNGHAAVRGRVQSVGVGHYFPTYVVPKVYVTLHLRTPGSESREIARHVIGRTLNVNLDHELSDTRLAPGADAVLATEVAVPVEGANIELRVEVAPAEHYERMFAAMDERYRDLSTTTAALLREARRQAVAARYVLDTLSVPVPTLQYHASKSVAN